MCRGAGSSRSVLLGGVLDGVCDNAELLEEPWLGCRAQRALDGKPSCELSVKGTEVSFVAGCCQTAPVGSSVEHHGLDDLRIDGGIALGVPRSDSAGRVWPKASEPVRALAEQVSVPEEGVPEARTLHVARVEHARSVAAQEPVVTPLGADNLGETSEVELVGGRLDGPAAPEAVGNADLVVIVRHPDLDALVRDAGPACDTASAGPSRSCCERPLWKVPRLLSPPGDRVLDRRAWLSAQDAELAS